MSAIHVLDDFPLAVNVNINDKIIHIKYLTAILHNNNNSSCLGSILGFIKPNLLYISLSFSSINIFLL